MATKKKTAVKKTTKAKTGSGCRNPKTGRYLPKSKCKTVEKKTKTGVKSSIGSTCRDPETGAFLPKSACAPKKAKRNLKSKVEVTITKDMIIGDVMNSYPQTKLIFLEYGLMCAICGMSTVETIETGALAHGINIEELLVALNKSIET